MRVFAHDSVQYINSKHGSRLVKKCDLQAIYSKYRPKHHSLQVHWHPSCKEIVSKYDVLQVIFVYMISNFNLNVRKMGSKYDMLQLNKDVCRHLVLYINL